MSAYFLNCSLNIWNMKNWNYWYNSEFRLKLKSKILDDVALLLQLSQLNITLREIFEGTKDRKSQDRLPFLAQKIFDAWCNWIPRIEYENNEGQRERFPLKECKMGKFKMQILANILAEGRARGYFEGEAMGELERKMQKEVVQLKGLMDHENCVCYQWRWEKIKICWDKSNEKCKRIRIIRRHRIRTN